MVFDSLIKHSQTPFNGMLQTGPDLMASLIVVLLRFCERPVTVCGDMGKMFYIFIVGRCEF